MFRSLLCVGLAVSLAACGATGPVASTGPAPAQPSTSPLSQTSIDDKAVIVAFEALDAAASAADALLAAGVIAPGSTTALRLADSLSAAKTWLNTASIAQRAGQAENRAAALAQAAAALAAVRQALKGN